jgi:hypothetical protein
MGPGHGEKLPIDTIVSKEISGIFQRDDSPGGWAAG